MASGNPAADNSSFENPASGNSAAKDRMTRREAMLQLLRLTGAGAGTAAAAVWLAKHSAFPVSTAAANARRDHTVEADSRAAGDGGGAGRRAERHRSARAGAAGVRRPGRSGAVHRAWRRGGAEAEHRVGPHAGAGGEHQSRRGGRGGEAVRAGRGEAGDCDRRKLQRRGALLPPLRHCGRGARRGCGGGSARSGALPRGEPGRRDTAETGRSSGRSWRPTR